MEFVWFLMIGAVAGWLAGQFMKGGGFGLLIAAAVVWRWLGAQQFDEATRLSEADDARARHLLDGKAPRKEKQRK